MGRGRHDGAPRLVPALADLVGDPHDIHEAFVTLSCAVICRRRLRTSFDPVERRMLSSTGFGSRRNLRARRDWSAARCPM